MSYKLVLIRHGQSIYNFEKRFCGWTDVDLTEKGTSEAHQAGQALKAQGFTFDNAFTSYLERAIDTLTIVLQEIGQAELPIERSWRLNERHYGALQGLKHQAIIEHYGKAQFDLWHRSFKVRPPQLTKDDPRYPGLDPKYKDLSQEELPLGESLEDTIKRVLPYWNGKIAPEIKKGRKVIVAASGNSLRALIKHLDQISDDDIVGLEIATGSPLVYELDEATLEPIKHYYLTSSQLGEQR